MSFFSPSWHRGLQRFLRDLVCVMVFPAAYRMFYSMLVLIACLDAECPGFEEQRPPRFSEHGWMLGRNERAREVGFPGTRTSLTAGPTAHGEYLNASSGQAIGSIAGYICMRMYIELRSNFLATRIEGAHRRMLGVAFLPAAPRAMCDMSGTECSNRDADAQSLVQALPTSLSFGVAL